MKLSVPWYIIYLLKKLNFNLHLIITAIHSTTSVKEPTCHFDIPCGFGNVVFNHTGVSVVDCDVVEYGHNLHGHILGVQLKASVGDI